MRFEDLRKLEKRYEGAAADVERLAAALSRDIKENPSISPAEMKFKVQTMLGSTAAINMLTAMLAEMAYRIALETEPAPAEGAEVGDEAGEGKSGVVVNGRIVMTGSAAGKTPPERESESEDQSSNAN